MCQRDMARNGQSDPTATRLRGKEWREQLARLLVLMEAAEVRGEYVEGGGVDVGNEGNGTSARPARDEEPGSGH